MDSQPDNTSEITPDIPTPPDIPPPDLSRSAPPPPSPLESMPKSSPPPLAAAGNPEARVNLRNALDEGESPGGRSAAFNVRITAAAVDLVVAMGLNIGVMLIFGIGNRLGFLAGLAYLIARDSLPFLDGQSVGKKAMKLRAVTLEGKSLVNNWQAALIRNGVLIIPFFGLVELFILLTREDKPEQGRRLGDEWAKTRVILEPKPPAAEDAV